MVEIFMCPRSLVAQCEAGSYPDCGVQLAACHPEAQGNPRRRPPMNAKGQVLSRAPLWWLKHATK